MEILMAGQTYQQHDGICVMAMKIYDPCILRYPCIPFKDPFYGCKNAGKAVVFPD